LYPNAPSLPAPDRIEYLRSFDDNQDLPDNAGQRIYGWFTPPVSGNYVFYVACDDASALWLSTNSDPAHAYQIAQNQAWMSHLDWTNSNTGSGETPYVPTGEFRSDRFELGGGPNAVANAISGWSPWPALNADGSIPLTAGNNYYIELDDYEGGGGQNASVTYKLAGALDPLPGSAPLLKAGNISTMSAPDTALPQPQPRITRINLSGSNVTISGTNGLVNAAYNVLASTNVALPMSQWTVVANGRFDSSGNFSSTNAVGASGTRFLRLQVP
jgi:hypothetical protein